jgi:hypothetical protein
MDISDVPSQLDIKMEKFPLRPDVSSIIMNQTDFEYEQSPFTVSPMEGMPSLQELRQAR